MLEENEPAPAPDGAVEPEWKVAAREKHFIFYGLVGPWEAEIIRKIEHGDDLRV
jgi:hypothetical protein